VLRALHAEANGGVDPLMQVCVFAFTDGLYTQSTHAHPQRELIRECGG